MIYTESQQKRVFDLSLDFSSLYTMRKIQLLKEPCVLFVPDVLHKYYPCTSDDLRIPKYLKFTNAFELTVYLENSYLGRRSPISFFNCLVLLIRTKFNADADLLQAKWNDECSIITHPDEFITQFENVVNSLRTSFFIEVEIVPNSNTSSVQSAEPGSFIGNIYDSFMSSINNTLRNNNDGVTEETSVEDDNDDEPSEEDILEQVVYNPGINTPSPESESELDDSLLELA